jgi:hypothetical protein
MLNSDYSNPGARVNCSLRYARLGGRTFQENVAAKATVLSAMHRQLFSSSSEP